jgi:kynureninase
MRDGALCAPLSLESARALDAADPLRGFRSRFVLPRDECGEPLLYLCGHSLGLMPLAARAEVAQELDDWERLGVIGHHSARRPWMSYQEVLRPQIAELVGCQDDEVVVMNSLTVNLHFMLASFYRPETERRRILIEAGAFSSDRFAVVSQLHWHGLDPRDALIELAPRSGEDVIREEAIEELLAERGPEIALVLWPGVQYLTGQAFDLPRIAAAARAAGAIIGFDLAHYVGNMPLTLSESEADFAVWCSYKYLNAGPGAIAGCYVNSRYFTAPGRQRLAGWWGHEMASRFEMTYEFRAAQGASGFQVSNQSPLSTAPLIASLAIFREAGMARLRAKSVALGEFLGRLLAGRIPRLHTVTPQTTTERGAQLSLRVDGGATRGRSVFHWLMQHGVVCDWREPDIIRVSHAPLYNSFEDAFDFVERLQRALRQTG